MYIFFKLGIFVFSRRFSSLSEPVPRKWGPWSPLDAPSRKSYAVQRPPKTTVSMGFSMGFSKKPSSFWRPAFGVLGTSFIDFIGTSQRFFFCLRFFWVWLWLSACHMNLLYVYHGPDESGKLSCTFVNETLPRKTTLCPDPTFPFDLQVEYVTPLTFSSEEGAPLASVACHRISLSDQIWS